MDEFRNQHLKEDPNKDKTLFKLIARFIAGEIKHKGRDKSTGSLNNYRAVKIHLEDYQQKKGYKIDFEAITLDFFYSYTTFLKKVTNLSPNTIQKDITLLKLFMGEAVDLGYTNNLQWKHKKFTVEGVETDATYLTDQELMKIYRHDFTGKKKLQQVRDTFLVGAFSGLRHSDFKEITLGNIVEIDGDQFIKIITQKTKDLVIIPSNPIIKEIFEKYKGLPRPISNQKFNDYIKDVCKEVGLTETGRLSSDPKKELWETVASHTARRSFATNTYLEGFPTLELMKITGHKTEKSFLKYIKVSKLDSAKRLSAHNKQNWSKKLLKVAS